VHQVVPVAAVVPVALVALEQQAKVLLAVLQAETTQEVVVVVPGQQVLIKPMAARRLLVALV
jgi:hypothetical protein